MRNLRIHVVVLAVVAAAAPAGAEMYRCEKPDGTITFTGDASACPGAAPHAPKGNLQRALGGDSGSGAAMEVDPSTGEAEAPRPRPAKRRDAAADEEAAAATWRAKRSEAEAESQQIESALEEFREMVTWCNRGGTIELQERTGMRRDYSCTEARSQHDRLSARAAELKRYLSGGLQEECRREGCLPGWIR
jgi:hypothetical protein